MNHNDGGVVESALNVLKFVTEGMVNNKNVISKIANEAEILLQPMVSYFEIKLHNFQRDKEKDNREKAVIIIMNCLMKGKNRDVATFLI